MKQKIKYLAYDLFILALIIGCTIEADNMAISSDEVKISFDVQGNGETALMLIHGWGNNRSIWDAQVFHFSKKYKVVNIDLPGFGQSGNNRQDWTMEAFGKDVVTVAEKLNLKQVVLVGFSMGGPVVIEAANMIPDKVAGVVLVDNLQDPEMIFPPPVISYMDSVMMDLVTNPTLEKIVGGGFIKKNPEESYARMQAMLNNVQMIGWRECLHGFAGWHNEKKKTALQNCQAPIHAINSDLQPTHVGAFMKLSPSYEVKVVPDVGHVIMWDATDEFNRLLEESVQSFIKK